MQRFVGFTFFLASLAIAAAAVHVAREPAKVDYSSLAHCISEARYEHPLGNQHQELVNAMYACGVYKLPVG
jgi:hypothetical protein